MWFYRIMLKVTRTITRLKMDKLSMLTDCIKLCDFVWSYENILISKQHSENIFKNYNFLEKLIENEYLHDICNNRNLLADANHFVWLQYVLILKLFTSCSHFVVVYINLRFDNLRPTSQNMLCMKTAMFQ